MNNKIEPEVLAALDRVPRCDPAKLDAILAELGVPQPAPGATVNEVIEGLAIVGFATDRGTLVVETDRLRAALSTLSPAQLRGMLTAIGGGK